MSSTSFDLHPKGEPKPYIGARLRVVWQWVRDQMFEVVVAAGYDDLNAAHIGLSRYPGLEGLRRRAHLRHLKDPASTDTTRGWARVTGLTAITLMLTCALITRNGRIIDTFEARAGEDNRRATLGQPPRHRRRQRRSIAELIDTA